MQNVISHTPIAISKKVIDANPSTGKQMSYLEYFGALIEGSPYAYKELIFFDPEKINNQNGAVKIYKNTPEILSTVKKLDDFITLINQTDYYKGLDFSFFAPNPDVVDEIVHWLIYNSPFTWDNGHRDYVGDSVIYNCTFTSSKEKSESITDASTNKNSDSNTNNFTVPSRIENSQTSNSNNTVKKVAPKIGDKGPGGKSDWYLPTRDQLFLIYWNLLKEGKIRGGAWYWTSSTDGDEFAWEQSLLEAGAQVRNYKDSTDAVLAIREFEY